MLHPASMTSEQRDAARYKGGIGAVVCRPKGVDCVAYISTFLRGEGERIHVVAYAGKAIKPSAHYTFGTREKAGDWVTRWAAAVKEQEQSRKARWDERNAFAHSLKVGDVLDSMWGYDQTNIDFYEVTRLVGAKSVEVRKIAAAREHTGHMTGTCTPIAGRFVGEAMTKRVGRGNSVRINSCATASPWEGKPRSWSSYA